MSRSPWWILAIGGAVCAATSPAYGQPDDAEPGDAEPGGAEPGAPAAPEDAAAPETAPVEPPATSPVATAATMSAVATVEPTPHLVPRRPGYGMPELFTAPTGRLLPAG